MAITVQVVRGVVRYGRGRLLKKLVRAVPWLGAAVAVATLGQTMRRKGVVRGSVDSALDAVPFIGGAKSICEALRGRDFIPEKRKIERRT